MKYLYKYVKIKECALWSCTYYIYFKTKPHITLHIIFFCIINHLFNKQLCPFFSHIKVISHSELKGRGGAFHCVGIVGWSMVCLRDIWKGKSTMKIFYQFKSGSMLEISSLLSYKQCEWHPCLMTGQHREDTYLTTATMAARWRNQKLFQTHHQATSTGSLKQSSP